MSEPDDQSIVPHPELQQVVEEVELLRDELAAQVGELHDLEHIVKPNLLALFQTKLGPWELRLLQAQCEVARWKRKAELVQAGINRGQPPDMAQIEAKLEAEFLTWRQRLEESAQKLAAAQFCLGHLLGPAEDGELKKLFYKLAKQLHPDVNPGLSAAQRDLWLQVLAAYEGGDLQKLKLLQLLVNSGALIKTASGKAALTEEHKRLRENLQRIYTQLAQVKSQPPFSMRAQWQDDAWVMQRRGELETLTTAAQSQALALEQHLAAMLIVYGTGKQSGLN